MIISIDSQILNSIQGCARKTQYHFRRNLVPLEKAEALEKGDLIHKLLEIYYSMDANLINPESDTWQTLASEGLYNASVMDRAWSRSQIAEFAAEVAVVFASKMELPAQDVEETVYQFREYCEHFEHDSWKTLAVEAVASKILFAQGDFQIIYNGKIDRFAEQGNLRMPWDHKTSKRRQDPNSMSNQFIGYAWLMETNHMLVNKIGFQKTLSRKERFQREILTISKARIDEWVENTIWWVMQLLNHEQENNWPMNLTSCDKYSGCQYKKICEADLESREYIINRHFKEDKPWDVATILEAQ